MQTCRCQILGGCTLVTDRHPIPLAVRAAFTLWMLCWVSVVLANQGPQNFFWLCNMAQFILLYALWSGNCLLWSSQAGLVCLVGLGWTLDLIVALLLGGRSPTGFTSYMFSDELSLLARLSSLYHVGLPPFLIWLVWRAGYDERGPWLQSVIGALGLLGAWLLTEPYRNINWIFAPFGFEQVWMPEWLWLLVLMLLYPLLLYFPGHFLVRWIRASLRQRK